MKYRMFDVLVCPKCKQKLTLGNEWITEAVSNINIDNIKKPHCSIYCGKIKKPINEVQNEIDCVECFNLEIESGVLRCEQCRAIYPIYSKIPRLLIPETDKDNQVKNRFEFQWELWGKENKIFGRTEEENTDYILKGYSNMCLENKLVLDAGCGHGRFLKSFSALGAESIGLDFGSGVEIAQKFNEKDSMVHIVMGDILNMPFRNECIDYVFSTGVIHHTAEPKRAFNNLSDITQKGGMMFIWVYPKESMLWEIVQKSLRTILTRIPARILYYLCFIPVPLLSLVKTYSSTSLKKASWKQCAQVIYDWYSPKYQFHYSEKELKDWFINNNFSDIEPFYIKTGMCGVKNVDKYFDNQLLVLADPEPLYLPNLIAKLAKQSLVEAIVVRRKVKVDRKKMIGAFGYKVLFVSFLCLILAKLADIVFKNKYYSLEKVAKNFRIPLYYIDKVHSEEFYNILNNVKTSTVFSQVSTKLKKELLNKAFFINRHCGMLPAYAGVNPVFWAMLNKEDYLAVTLHIMNKNYDDGMILSRSLILNENIKFFPAYHRLFDLCAHDFQTVLNMTSEEITTYDTAMRSVMQKSYYSYPTKEDRMAFLRTGNKFGIPFRLHPSIKI